MKQRRIPQRVLSRVPFCSPQNGENTSRHWIAVGRLTARLISRNCSILHVERLTDASSSRPVLIFLGSRLSRGAAIRGIACDSEVHRVRSLARFSQSWPILITERAVSIDRLIPCPKAEASTVIPDILIHFPRLDQT